MRGSLTPANTVFCLLAFEGPDPYALAGGLGIRVTHLAETLARRGFPTHLFFVGDPAAAGTETRVDGRLVLHRWCQWISAYHPKGVYDGEDGKRRDFADSLPPVLIREVIGPAAAAKRLPVVLAEEWQTAEAVIRLSDQLHADGLRERCVLFWNANNTMGFDRIDWPRLSFVAQLTTVSRYMKHVMWQRGLNPLVIPNGIPAEDLIPVDPLQTASVRQALGADDGTVLLVKVGRFDPAKRWLMAVDAAGLVKARGHRMAFVMRGGMEPHGREVLTRAQEVGLQVTDVDGTPGSWEDVLTLLREVPPADVYNVRFFLPHQLLRPFYAAADAVLAASGHEPFGLVGLEAMAAGGLVFTGATGEEYTLGGRSAIVVDTDNPEEVVTHLLALRTQPRRMAAIRRTARRHAAHFTWERVLDTLLAKVAFVAQTSGALERRAGVRGRRRTSSRPRRQDRR